MPTLRGNNGRLTRGRREHLLLGFALLRPGGYPDPSPWTGRPEPDAEAREDWLEHREELMRFWLQDPVEWAKTNRPGFGNPAPGGPRTRPAAWWWFDGPKAYRKACPPDLAAQPQILARHGIAE